MDKSEKYQKMADGTLEWVAAKAFIDDEMTQKDREELHTDWVIDVAIAKRFAANPNPHKEKVLRYLEQVKGISIAKLNDEPQTTPTEEQETPSTVEEQEKSLLEVVDELPQLDKKQFDKQFVVANNAINDWLDKETSIWENEILTTIPKEKIGLYFLGKVTKLLDEFHDFLPYTIEDWNQMKQGEECFYCMAIEDYLLAICDLLRRYDIEDDDSIRKMYALAWFYFDEFEEMEETEVQQAPPTEIMTDRAKKYFEKAIKAGYMEKAGNGYKWTFSIKRGAKAALCYFIMKVYSPDPRSTKTIHYKALEELFGVTRLDSAMRAMWNVTNRQEWRDMIDALFND